MMSVIQQYRTVLIQIYKQLIHQTLICDQLENNNNFNLITIAQKQSDCIIMQPQKQEFSLNHLPRQPQLRQQLKQAIDRYRGRLQATLLHETQKNNAQDLNRMEQLQNKIQKLQLRVKLIDDCSQLSILRLDHLQQIFRHYCTHIFRTGSYMTFDRLQYQKVNLTMDRFFLFLKDFQLTAMIGTNNKKEQVIQKSKIITIFKKVSHNSRQLSFEEFIQCIDKLGIMYYDQKQVFYQKKQQQKLQKQKRKQEYEKNRKKLLKKRKKDLGEVNNQQSDDQKQEGGQDEEGDADQNQQQQQEQQKQSGIKKQSKKQIKTQQLNSKAKNDKNAVKQQNGQQNDDLVQDMINDKDLEDPNEEVNKITNRYAFQEEEQQQMTPRRKNLLDNVNDELFLILTNQQKIQFYYQSMIKVDSVSDYRKKMTNLNLTTFQNFDKNQKIRSKNKTESKGGIKQSDIQQRSRAEELRRKMEQKKLKQKVTPVISHKDDGAWAKAEQQKKKKRQLKKQREVNAKKKNKQETDAVLQKKLDSQKSVKQKVVKQQQYNQNQVDWNMLGKLSIDQLKIKQFNPNRYFSKDDEDKIFLDQYEGGGRPRIMSGMAIRERNSVALVQDMKKRVNQVQKRQKKQQKQLDSLSKKIGQNIPVKSRF